MNKMEDAKSAAPAPSLPDIPSGFVTPAGYKTKRCKYCRAYSSSKTPLPAGVYPSWDPIIPWFAGKQLNPKGLVCRICYTVFVLDWLFWM